MVGTKKKKRKKIGHIYSIRKVATLWLSQKPNQTNLRDQICELFFISAII